MSLVSGLLSGRESFKQHFYFVQGEKVNMERFSSLGVIENVQRKSLSEVNAFLNKLESVFSKDIFTKAEIVKAIKDFIPNFEHEEKNKYLDQKM